MKRGIFKIAHQKKSIDECINREIDEKITIEIKIFHKISTSFMHYEVFESFMQSKHFIRSGNNVDPTKNE